MNKYKYTKMKQFFEETEIKIYSHNDKLKYILEKLLTWLNPVEVDRRNESYYTYDHKYKHYTVISAECNFDNLQNIIKNFKNININVSEKFIIIKGENFEYKFDPQQILTINERLQKAFKKSIK